MLGTILKLGSGLHDSVVVRSGRGANTGADQLDSGYRRAERHVHGAAGRAI